MHDIPKSARRLVLLAAALAALAAAPAAQAGLHVSMTSTGLNVTTDQSNATEVLQITGLANPEGSIGNWSVDPLCVMNIFDPTGAGCTETSDRRLLGAVGLQAGRALRADRARHPCRHPGRS